MPESLDFLEDLIVLVTESDVAVYFPNTDAAKSFFFPLLTQLEPYVHLFSPEDALVADVDLLQAHKIRSFRRMLLSLVPKEGVIGINVPSGYSDLSDLEGWPMIQAFALEEEGTIGPSPGFFTLCYGICDVSSVLTSIFHSIDMHMALQKREDLLTHLRSEGSSFLEALPSFLSERSLSEKELLDSLFIENDLHTSSSHAYSHRLFAGARARRIVSAEKSSTEVLWSESRGEGKTEAVSSSLPLHLVVEACDAVSGLRCCRSYFLASPCLHPLFILSQEGQEEDREEEKGGEFENLTNCGII